jgi:hypothetical protein
LADYLARITDYGECACRIESHQAEHLIVTGQSGTEFRVQLRCNWAEKPSGRVRVEGTIRYTGIAGFVQLS